MSKDKKFICISLQMEVIEENESFVFGILNQTSSENETCYIIADKEIGIIHSQENHFEPIFDIWNEMTLSSYS